MKKAAGDASSLGIRVHGLFMVGFPKESWADFMETVRMIIRNKKSFSRIFCSPTAVYSGTYLHENSKNFGISGKDSNFFVRHLRLSIILLLAKALNAFR